MTARRGDSSTYRLHHSADANLVSWGSENGMEMVDEFVENHQAFKP